MICVLMYHVYTVMSVKGLLLPCIAITLCECNSEKFPPQFFMGRCIFPGRHFCVESFSQEQTQWGVSHENKKTLLLDVGKFYCSCRKHYHLRKLITYYLPHAKLPWERRNVESSVPMILFTVKLALLGSFIHLRH